MRKQINEEGVITLEAAILVPIFVLLMLMLNGLFLMFMGQQIMTHAAIQSAKSLAMDPYAEQRVVADKQDQLADMFVDIFTIGNGGHVSTDHWYENNSGKVEQTVRERFLAYLGGSGQSTGLLDLVGVENGVQGLNFSGSSISADGVLMLKISYTQNFVFASDLTSMKQEIVLKVKLFEY